MKKCLPFLLIPLFISSCTVYEFMTVGSNQMDMNPRHEFVSNNDSILVIYNFNGENAPVNLVVKNYLNTPVFIDWKLSTMVVNGKAISYNQTSPIKIEGHYDGSAYRIGRSSTSEGNVMATATLPEEMSFIPGNTYISKTSEKMLDQFIYSVPDSAYHPKAMKLSNGTNDVLKQASFSEQSSPVHFVSYLAVRFGDPAAKPVMYQHNFFISTIIKTSEDPFVYGYAPGSQGDRYYVKGEPSN